MLLGNIAKEEEKIFIGARVYAACRNSNSARNIMNLLKYFRRIKNYGKKMADEEFRYIYGYSKSSLARLLALHDGFEERIRKECPKEIVSYLESEELLPLPLN